MKKTILLLTLMSIYNLTFGQIPNPSFEQWTNNSPNGWHSSNYAAPYVWETKDSNAYQGNYAVRSTIIQTGPVSNPAGIMTGDVTWTGYNPTLNHYGYVPITIKPTKLFGWYILQNYNLDTLTANIWLKKSGNIVGTGEFVTTAAKTNYNRFTIDINYTSTEQPDSFKIYITFDHGRPWSGHVGSYFIIDSLQFDINVDSSEFIFENEWEIYPNPAINSIYINCKEKQDLKMQIYNVVGELILQKELDNNKNEIDIRGLSIGLYIIKVTGANWSVNKKIIKE